MNPIRAQFPKTSPPAAPPPERPAAPPPQMSGPVGPPPPIVEAPKDFEGFMAAAVKARTGRIDYAQFWATMAQAEANNRIADTLSELVGLFAPVQIDVEEGVGESISVGSATITDGILSAKEAIIEEVMGLIPAELKTAFVALLKARAAEVLAAMQGAGENSKPGPSSVFDTVVGKKP